jgi:hypothetical protein
LWQEICKTWNDAQTLGVVVSEAISDPTFRGDGTVEAGESVDAAPAENSEG